MSSNDNKPDLSHLKSRLGLKKSKKKQGGQDQQSGGSGAQATVSKPKKAKRTQGQARSKGGGQGKKGGVNDRLAALKKSTLRSKAVEPEQPAPAEQVDQTGGTAGDGFDDFDDFDAPASSTTGPSAGGAAPAASRPASRGHGPPPGAQGPPPTAMAPPTNRRPKTRSAGSVAAGGDGQATEDIELSDEEVNLAGGSMFSLPVLVLFLILFVVGGAFGLFYAEASQSREIESTRISDAQSMLTDLEERFEALTQAQEIIGSLDPQDVDFEAAQQLSELEFWVDAKIYPNNRMLMGESVLGPLNQYVAQSNILTEMIKEHQALTNQVDREELEAFKEHSEGLDDSQQLAVVVFPEEGLLVLVDEDAEPNEEGEIDVHVVASDAPDTVDARRVVSMDATEFYQIDTDNALQRYARRVQRLQEYNENIDGQIERVRSALDELASAEAPPLISL